MELEPNPYASPTKSVPGEPLERCPELPLVLRPSLLTLSYAVPIGVLASITFGLLAIPFFRSLSTFLATSSSWLGITHPYFVICLAAMLFSAFLALGCLVSLRCKVIASESSIDVSDFRHRNIQYSEVESWLYHPATGFVTIVSKSKKRYLTVNNWAMSKKKTKQLGIVLQEKVGDPSEYFDRNRMPWI